MNIYDTEKLSLRPHLPNVIIDENMNPDERFQNETLRPIMKIQHELIIALVKGYFKKKKNAFYNLTLDKREDYIKTNLLGDPKIIHELRGLVIGLFTIEEMEYYLLNKATINKRIQALLLQRMTGIAKELGS